MRVTMELLHKTIGCGRVPAVFWGSEGSQGQGDCGAMGTPCGCNRFTIAYGLILMGAWCGSELSATTNIENQGA